MTKPQEPTEPAASWWTVVVKGQTLVHRVFGEGTVVTVEERRVTVHFADPLFGTKMLKRGPSTFDIRLIDRPHDADADAS